jgi:hypothetical protein
MAQQLGELPRELAKQAVALSVRLDVSLTRDEVDKHLNDRR